MKFQSRDGEKKTWEIFPNVNIEVKFSCVLISIDYILSHRMIAADATLKHLKAKNYKSTSRVAIEWQIKGKKSSIEVAPARAPSIMSNLTINNSRKISLISRFLFRFCLFATRSFSFIFSGQGCARYCVAYLRLHHYRLFFSFHHRIALVSAAIREKFFRHLIK